MVRDEDGVNVYEFDNSKKFDLKKIFVIVCLIIFLICTIITVNNIMVIINEHKAYEQYEAQLNALKHQEEEWH